MNLDPRILDAFAEANDFSLEDHLLMACKVGSESHGTRLVRDNYQDDEDYFMVVVPPPVKVLGLNQWDHWVYQQDELDVVVYSLAKYVKLLLKGNPNVVGTLWLDNYLYVSHEFKLLIAKREKFLSKHILSSFGGYADAQFQKIFGGKYQGYMGAQRKALFDEYGYDPKNVAHCIRLYRMAIEAAETGKLNVFRPDAAELVAIKSGALGKGQVALTAIQEEQGRLNVRFREAKDNSVLPKEPDRPWAESQIIDITFEVWEALGCL